MYEYLFPVALLMLLVSIGSLLLKNIVRINKERFIYLHRILEWPVTAVFFIGLIYYWVSPFTGFGEKLITSGIFMIVLSAGPVAGRFLETEIQSHRYAHYLLEAVAFLSVLWIVLSG